MPWRLRRHKFQPGLPKDKALPSPEYRYDEIETVARVCGGNWEYWEGLNVGERADLIYHEHERRMREAYMHDIRMAQFQKTETQPRGKSDWERVEDRFFDRK